MDKDPVAGLVDFPLPAEISLWPTTWPSRIAVALIIIALAVAMITSIRRWHANRYRRAALAELDRLAGNSLSVDALALLVRRTALSVFPRDTIAPLSGADWLTFLDRSYGGSEFTQGAGGILARGPYDHRSVSQSELDAAAVTVRRWIRAHHA